MIEHNKNKEKKIKLIVKKIILSIIFDLIHIIICYIFYDLANGVYFIFHR